MCVTTVWPRGPPRPRGPTGAPRSWKWRLHAGFLGQLLGWLRPARLVPDQLELLHLGVDGQPPCCQSRTGESDPDRLSMQFLLVEEVNTWTEFSLRCGFRPSRYQPRSAQSRLADYERTCEKAPVGGPTIAGTRWDPISHFEVARNPVRRRSVVHQDQPRLAKGVMASGEHLGGRSVLRHPDAVQPQRGGNNLTYGIIVWIVCCSRPS